MGGKISFFSLTRCLLHQYITQHASGTSMTLARVPALRCVQLLWKLFFCFFFHCKIVTAEGGAGSSVMGCLPGKAAPLFWKLERG